MRSILLAYADVFLNRGCRLVVVQIFKAGVNLSGAFGAWPLGAWPPGSQETTNNNNVVNTLR